MVTVAQMPNVLVDFDNLPRHLTTKPLLSITDRVLHAIGEKFFETDQLAAIRLYGGWYEKQSLTRRAQSLVADLQANFPRNAVIVQANRAVTVMVRIELAYSLVAEPSRHLFHTYRKRIMPSGLQCAHPSNGGCTELDCPLNAMHDFFSSDRCPISSCIVKPHDLISKNEQKLVDTMLTTDLVHFAYSGCDRLAIVTSDDDFWPGIRTAILSGASVYHIHTLPDRVTPSWYSSGVGSSYVQRTL